MLKYDQYKLTRDFNSHSTSNAENMTRDTEGRAQSLSLHYGNHRLLTRPEEHILNIFHSNFAVWQRFAALIISCKLFENLSPAPSINNFVPILELLIAG